MIEVKNLTKHFDDIIAVDNISASIKEGNVFGLIGSNGAGKSTFLRMLSGVLRPDSGEITIDGQPVFENIAVKERFFFIPDKQYFFANTTPLGMMKYYKSVYKNFSTDRFHHMMNQFDLDEKRRIGTFSKGMKKQVSVICAMSAMTDYVFCDETFDGLDPVARQAVKSLFAADIADRGLTPVIASHNLRELEDICDHVGLLHKGGILFNKDLEDMKLGIHKIQCAWSEPLPEDSFKAFDIMSSSRRGNLYVLTVKGEKEDISSRFAALNPVFFEMIPLSLEEIFISETEVLGYDVKKLIG